MSSRVLCGLGAWTILVAMNLTSPARGEDNPFIMHEPPAVVGRWDLTVHGPDGDYPSWLEVRQSGYRTLVGSFVGRFGSARPISNVEFTKGHLRFVIPPQWERRTSDLVFEGKLDGEMLSGESTDEAGKRVTWEARKAPALNRDHPPHWGTAVELFDGKNLSGWKPRSTTTKNGWVIRDGLLVNVNPGNDLMTERTFSDFKLAAEFRYPKGSNSGIYLRGRYEMQIEDNFGAEADSHKIGGIYGFLTPSVNAAKKAGEWQTVEITLLGRIVTVVFNGERVIDRQTIPGITGGAIDSKEGEPGPLLLQGDHGQIEFRKVTITPAD
jgi:Domain of Unknown Function (DUF1080)